MTSCAMRIQGVWLLASVLLTCSTVPALISGNIESNLCFIRENLEDKHSTAFVCFILHSLVRKTNMMTFIEPYTIFEKSSMARG
jgi:hypothetical protein